MPHGVFQLSLSDPHPRMITVRTAIYTRISRDDGTVQGLGVARQEADCRALAERNSWTVVEVFSDNDTSAYSGRPRPAYLRMVEAVKAGAFDAIVAWHPDRLHRSPLELEGFIDVVEASGVAVATVRAGTLDLSTASGRMTARVVGAVARHESEQKSERQRRKAEELALAGKVGGGGPRPFGFKADRVTVDPVEAAVVREIAARLLAGDSLRSVATWLNDSGVATSTGVAWRVQTLRRMMLSSRIAGRRRFRGVDFGDAEWDAILDEVTWRRVAAAIEARRGQRGPGRRYLLTGLVACGLCGAKLVARPKADGRQCVVCATGVGNDGCGKIRQLCEPLDAMVVRAVVARCDDPGLLRRVAQAPSVDEGAVLGELAAAGDRRCRLAAQWAAGDLDDESWAAARAALDSLEEELRRRLPSNQPAALAWAGRGEDLAERWGRLHIDQQRAIVASVVERIDLAPAVRGRNFFDPGRVTVTWR